METTVLVWDEAEYLHLVADPTGPIGRFWEELGIRGEQLAKRRAAVSKDGSNGRPPGYMRDRITHEVGHDSEGLYVDLISPATTPTGYPYGLGIEVGTVAHLIRSHGPYPLRDRKTGRIFGHRQPDGTWLVHHPGTNPQPYLRPAVAELMALL